MKFDYNSNILSQMGQTTFFSWVHKVFLRLPEGCESQALAFILLKAFILLSFKNSLGCFSVQLETILDPRI